MGGDLTEQKADFSSMPFVYLPYVVAIIASMALIVSANKTYSECSTLCVSGGYLQSGQISAFLSVGGRPLRNAGVSVYVNSRFGAVIRTNNSGSMEFYAPLAIGRNMLEYRYGNADTRAYLYYYGPYVWLAYALAGCCIFLLIRKIPIHTMLDRKAVICYPDESGGTNKDPMPAIINAYLSMKQLRASDGVAVPLGELCERLGGFSNAESNKVLQESLRTRLDNSGLEGKLFIKGNFVCDYGDFMPEFLLGGWLYERWAKEGSCMGGSDCPSLGHANGFVTYCSATLELVASRKMDKPVKFAVFDVKSKVAANGRLHTCGIFGSSVLLMRLCGIAGVEVVSSI